MTNRVQFRNIQILYYFAAISCFGSIRGYNGYSSTVSVRCKCILKGLSTSLRVKSLILKCLFIFLAVECCRWMICVKLPGNEM
jgi:hypothetical protein